MTNINTYTSAEKQLISTLAWFRSRYALFMGLSLDRKADRQSLEAFGQIWIGTFKEDWAAAFDSLLTQNILSFTHDEYAFTDFGNTVKVKVDAETPFYKYEYDNFFWLASNSKAHARFCEKVYGLDLSQHGLIDQQELSVLVALLKNLKPQTILDVGCGNGRITKWIAKETQAFCTGIDISKEAIRHARERKDGNGLLYFEEGNLNNLRAIKQHDCVLYLDTLYYANDMQASISEAAGILSEGGRIFAYFSQWIMDEAYADNLLPDNTQLAKILKELKLPYTYTNLTESGIRHWRSKLAVLEQMKQDFWEEGSNNLWEYRHREAQRYANWGDDKYARYLYEIGK